MLYIYDLQLKDLMKCIESLLPKDMPATTLNAYSAGMMHSDGIIIGSELILNE